VLLSADDSRAEFTVFRCVTFPEFAGLYQSNVVWRDEIRPASSDQGHNVLTVEIATAVAHEPGRLFVVLIAMAGVVLFARVVRTRPTIAMAAGLSTASPHTKWHHV
jgi:hypothetical protein